MSIFALYWTFFQFGLLCFGGGYMLVPLLSAELVGPGRPLGASEFANLVSIAQVTPGPIGINTATYVGFTQLGVAGAVVATLGIVTPALFLVILAVKGLKRYESSVWVRGFLAGMRPASFGLVLAAAWIFSELSIFAGGRFYWGCAVIAATTTVLMLKTRVPMHYLLLGSAVAGALVCR